MSTKSTYEEVFKKLGTMSNELGSDISEFMNVFKMIHCYTGTTTPDGATSDKVKSMGMITEEMVAIYDGFLDYLTEGTTDENYTMNYSSEYLPVMPDLIFLYDIKENGNSSWMTNNLYPRKVANEDKITVDVETRNGDMPIGMQFKTYKETVLDTLNKFLTPRVYKLFTTPVQEIDDINKADNKSFSEKFKKLKIYQNEKSFFDYLMAFAENELIEKDQDLSLSDSDANADELYDIYDMFQIYEEKDRPDHLNSLVIDIMENQKKIENKKDRVAALRKKLYTYASRDENYTQILNGEKLSMRLTVLMLIVITAIFGAVSLKKNTSNLTKATIISSIAILILSFYIIKQMYVALTQTGKKTVKEGFAENSGLGFTEQAGSDDGDLLCNRLVVLSNFIDKFSEVLSNEIKQEYFDALNESQEKDMDLLKQLENEHQTNSHFHQLKNNLTHFKINESKEFKKMAWNGILTACIIGLLYGIKLQRKMRNNMFMMISGVVAVIYFTYCLLNYKSIMLRDKQDWDRFHWVLNKIESNSTSGSCNGLSGFERK